jgi:acid phosphatase
VYDHIVIVVEENKDYREVVGSASAPYINGVLRAEGANLTRMFAEEHNSEGNYFWMFSGSNQSVGFRDAIPDEKNNKNYPFRSGNLGEALIQRGLTFRGYAEDLPEVGSTVTHAGHYARKHVPWISFADLPNGTSADSSVNLQFAQFPSDFSTLPTVSFVIPNLINDMHDPATQLKVSVKNADDWLKRNIDAYYQWARTHNSLLIVTFDENDDRSGYVGLTDPKSRNRDRRNRIPTIITGARIRHGDYPEGKGVTHVNLLRTLEAMYGLPKSGSQQRFAAKFGIADNVIITDIFTGQK